jgi:hypothetical protein
MDYERFWYCNNTTSDTLLISLAYGFPVAYPDTILPKNFNEAHLIIVNPKTKQTIEIKGVRDENFFSELPKDTLSVFILNRDTIKNYSWEDVRTNNKILLRIDLSFEDIKKLKFIIPYPPTEAMKDMKMWSPYDSVINRK